MGSTAIRNVKGKNYLYYIHYENGVKKTVYCGLSSKPESKRKSLKLEIKSLKEQKTNMSQKIIKIENDLKHMKV